MPVFDTREPISVHLDLGAGDVRIAAGDRTDTVVEVRPANPEKKGDVAAAEQTKVDFADGVLRITAPKGRWSYSFRGGSEAVAVRIELPAGSAVRGDAALAPLHATGRLGACRYKAGAGEIRVEEAGALSLTAGAGDITVARASGRCDIVTASGDIRIASVDGPAVIKNSNGDTEIGEVTGDLRVRAANGKVTVGCAHSTVAARSANGDIRVGEVRRGAVHVETAFGRIEIGVRDGVAAWLDLHTALGNVTNDLDAADRPGPGDETVEVKARTAYGDVTIHRSVPQATSEDRR
jgi:hypothetical protein